MAAFVSLTFILVLTLIGDYCIKLSTQHDAGMQTWVFAAGTLLYALPAVGWFFLMRSHSLASVGVIYSSATIVALALLGVVVFREAFTLREGAGVVLALLAVLVTVHD